VLSTSGILERGRQKTNRLVDHSFVQILSAIKRITDSGEFDDAEKVRQIRALLAAEEPDLYQAEASLAPMKRDLESETDGPATNLGAFGSGSLIFLALS
jgi:hypothetical protein